MTSELVPVSPRGTRSIVGVVVGGGGGGGGVVVVVVGHICSFGIVVGTDRI